MPKVRKVLIKNPRVLEGTVVDERPGKLNASGESGYRVRISEDEHYYRESDLEPIAPRKMERDSPEWNAELKRWIDAGTRLLANSEDSAARDAFVESGSILGFFVPFTRAGK